MATILAKDVVADQKILLGLETLTVIATEYRKPGKGHATVILDLLEPVSGVITQTTFLPDQSLTLVN